jgi:hypothetical protein
MACAIAMSLSACVQTAPPELLEAIESLDQQLKEMQGAEFAPEEYARFIKHWVTIKTRLLAEEDMIRWPWEPNSWITDLRALQEEGDRALEQSRQRRDAERRTVQSRLESLETRHRMLSTRVDEIGSRVMLGKKAVETEVLVRQARSLFTEGLFGQSEQAILLAARLMDDQTSMLTTELGRYADERKIDAWRRLALRAVDWSKSHRTASIVVNKAERSLTLYRNGRQVVSYPVRLGYNGMLEKRYQGDGATPEGYYRVIRKRNRGETQFYRALVLDYPNEMDRTRFQQGRRQGTIPPKALIGGQIEIHGGDDYLLSQTLGCIMLENAQMDLLFNEIDVGTPVAIIGALTVENTVASALRDLHQS